MFRDSRGVVHTVSSADPLDDLPPEAAAALARTLLVSTQGDLGSLLETCEAVSELLERWQDAFFAALPADIDLDEEARWAAMAGLTLEDIEDEWDDDEDFTQEPLEEIALEELTPFDDEPEGLFEMAPLSAYPSLAEDTVTELETALLLLPMRTRLEALVAATGLVAAWTDLFADHEKCLGHLVLKHGAAPDPDGHEVLVDLHAMLHAGSPEHSSDS